MQYEAGQSAVAEAVNGFMAEGCLGLLQAVAGTSQVVDALLRHYNSAVQPRLSLVRNSSQCCVLIFRGIDECPATFLLSICSKSDVKDSARFRISEKRN
jgi:hypothetical protein